MDGSWNECSVYVDKLGSLFLVKYKVKSFLLVKIMH